MKKKIYTSLSLLFVALSFSVAVVAQPGRSKDYNDNRNDRYEDRRNDRGDRDDRDGRYDKHDNRYSERDGFYDNNRYVIRHRPKAPYINQGRRPSPYHVWVDGEYFFSRGQYVFKPGYWAMPVRGMRYVAGNWERTRGGWFWTPGYWVKQTRW